jgi:hypothetical protein
MAEKIKRHTGPFEHAGFKGRVGCDLEGCGYRIDIPWSDWGPQEGEGFSTALKAKAAAKKKAGELQAMGRGAGPHEHLGERFEVRWSRGWYWYVMQTDRPKFGLLRWDPDDGPMRDAPSRPTGEEFDTAEDARQAMVEAIRHSYAAYQEEQRTATGDDLLFNPRPKRAPNPTTSLVSATDLVRKLKF